MANKIKIGLGGDASGTNETGANAVTNGSPRNIQPATVDRPVTVDRVVVSTPPESIAVAPSKEIPIEAAQSKPSVQPSVPVINAKETAAPTTTPTKKIAGDTGLNQTNTNKSTDYEVRPVTTTVDTPKKDTPKTVDTPKNDTPPKTEVPKNDDKPKIPTTGDGSTTTTTKTTVDTPKKDEPKNDDKPENKKPKISTTSDEDKTTVDKKTTDTPKKDDTPDDVPDRNITTTTTTTEIKIPPPVQPKKQNNYAQGESIMTGLNLVSDSAKAGVDVRAVGTMATNDIDGKAVKNAGIGVSVGKDVGENTTLHAHGLLSEKGYAVGVGGIHKVSEKASIKADVNHFSVRNGEDHEAKSGNQVRLGGKYQVTDNIDILGAVGHKQMKTFAGEKGSSTELHLGANIKSEVADGRAILSAGIGGNIDLATRNFDKSHGVGVHLGIGTNNKTSQTLIVNEQLANVKPVVEQVQKQTYSLNLNTDAMFAFNKGDAANLKPGAKMEVSKFVDTLLAPNATTDGKSILETMKEKGLPLEIVGRTDKFGENEAKYKNGKMVFQGNYALSDERANTTAQLIIAEIKRRTGEDITSMVRARGVGENEATVDEKMAMEQAKQKLGVNKETPAVRELARQYTQVDRNATSNLIGVDNIRPEFAQEKGLQVQVKTHTEQITKQVEVKEDHYYKLEGKRISSDPEKLKAQIAEGKVKVQEINPTEDEKMAAKASPINFTAMQSTNEAAKQAQEIEKQKVEQEQTLKNTSAFKPQ